MEESENPSIRGVSLNVFELASLMSALGDSDFRRLLGFIEAESSLRGIPSRTELPVVVSNDHSHGIVQVELEEPVKALIAPPGYPAGCPLSETNLANFAKGLRWVQSQGCWVQPKGFQHPEQPNKANAGSKKTLKKKVQEARKALREAPDGISDQELSGLKQRLEHALKRARDAGLEPEGSLLKNE